MGLRQDRASGQGGRVGLGTGKADVNVNRDGFVGDGWELGFNPDGPSDKTVWVMRFETSSGEPIAFLINYAAHAVALGPQNTLITGDIAGAAERFVEQYYRDRVVALWTIGAAGDQNPKYMSWDTTNGTGQREPGYPLNDALGQIVGEEVVRVAGKIAGASSEARIEAAEQVVTYATKPPRQREGVAVSGEALGNRLARARAMLMPGAGLPDDSAENVLLCLRHSKVKPSNNRP